MFLVKRRSADFIVARYSAGRRIDIYNEPAFVKILRTLRTRRGGANKTSFGDAVRLFPSLRQRKDRPDGPRTGMPRIDYLVDI